VRDRKDLREKDLSSQEGTQKSKLPTLTKRVFESREVKIQELHGIES
jgi:hypothetical protein